MHMTNCFSYYRFLLSCVIGLIVGGALNMHVELELEPLKQDNDIQWLVSGTRLLSVQIVLTRGLHPGPGVYVGPGVSPRFYSNWRLEIWL